MTGRILKGLLLLGAAGGLAGAEPPSAYDAAVEATPPEVSPPPRPGNAPTVFSASDFTWENKAFGKQAFLINRSSRTLDLLEIHATIVETGANSHEPHRHRYEEVLVLQSGRVEVEVNGVTEEIGPGSVMVFLSQDWHAVRNIGDEPAVYTVINVGPP
ncbi:cupin domain-containing protein [Altererythrobacter salegens]|uniref:Cupin domain-containing protein n=1 Tax=Croceibacterium salegens TaxID=1737568 RepID=A0A6I4T1G9_9SPHN|nr:cupin domain-containing protein [Croceibacterium salegens]MXO61156.1 cupin domain-containing protein [Croceibacterium salegens]